MKMEVLLMIKQILFIQMMQSIFHKIIFQEKEVFNIFIE